MYAIIHLLRRPLRLIAEVEGSSPQVNKSFSTKELCHAKTTCGLEWSWLWIRSLARVDSDDGNGIAWRHGCGQLAIPSLSLNQTYQ
ncbi:MAG: hypothetical protein FWG62_06650, partial [Proteobacteria bacterium]|nr:hypothetical protein [Pseudomonadota bacterium]